MSSTPACYAMLRYAGTLHTSSQFRQVCQVIGPKPDTIVAVTCMHSHFTLQQYHCNNRSRTFEIPSNVKNTNEDEDASLLGCAV